MLADFLWTLEFTLSRFDRYFEIWLCDDKTGYDYICTHIDDFKVVAKKTLIWINMIAFVFLIKENGRRNYYLGNDYTYHNGQNMWIYGYQIYAK